MKGTNLLTRLRRRGDEGLTLIELLIVITILGILAGITMLAAADLRGDATAKAAVTDAANVRTGEDNYCYKTGAYADRTNKLVLPPNNVLARPPGYSSAVPWTPDSYDFNDAIIPETSPDGTVYSGYRAGGAGAQSSAPAGCGGQNLVTGPTQPAASVIGDGPWIVSAPEIATVANFLTDSFRQLFGGVRIRQGVTGIAADAVATGGTPGIDDWLVVSTVSPTAAQPTTIRHFADAQLVLMACRSGGIAVPNTTLCQSPGILETPDTFGLGLPTAAGAAMTQLQTELNGHADCGFNPILVTQDPTTSLFGSAARNAVGTAIFDTEVSAHCVVFGVDPAGAQAILRSGGKTTSGATVHPAKYALLPKAASMDPTAVDTNSVVPIGTAVSIWGGVLNVPPDSNLANEAQARRFLNYLISPLGRAVLASYGFDPIAPTSDPATGPIPEN
jgi:prepilin-type N-terminal cleavage/methylation domain-containing protein